MPVGNETLMDGTTLCPHCNTRFRIAGTQLDAHQGMVRCGHCMQAFDARPGFIPDQPDPQLELPMADRPAPSAYPSSPAEPPQAAPQVPVEPETEAVAAEEKTEADAEPTAVEVQAEPAAETGKAPEPTLDEAQTEAAESEPPHDTSLDFVPPAANDSSVEEPQPAKPLVIQPVSLVETSGEETGEAEEVAEPPRKRRWPWIAASSLLALVLCLQALYFFRVELAARLPGLKPLLVGYCKPLNCTVPLPHNPDLMSIESSELEADPEHENRITLVALLRNRAAHVQAFPVLELSLNDTQDKVLARRQFKPADYLPATESEAAGLRPNRELNIRLKLDTTDLRPTGYRLALFYPQ